MKPQLLVVIADVHGGGSTAICHPQGIQLDDGGTYVPSDGQVWIWNGFVGHLRAAKQWADEEGAEITLGLNGDMVDGHHHVHSNAQFISPLESIHVRVAHKVISYAIEELQPKAIHMTRGTGSHTGKSSTLEEGLSRVLAEDDGYPIVPDPDTGNMTSYWRRYLLGGLLVDQRHHGRMGQRSYTRGSYLRLYAQDIENEHRKDGQRPPDIAVRSHNHVAEDSGRGPFDTTRVISTPCLQAPTEYSHKRAFEKLASLGIVAIMIRDGVDVVRYLLNEPERPTTIMEAA